MNQTHEINTIDALGKKPDRDYIFFRQMRWHEVWTCFDYLIDAKKSCCLKKILEIKKKHSKS